MTNSDKTEFKKEQVIISLTSFPPAIRYVVPAVKSLLAGLVLPDKIVLYLTYSQFGEEGVPKDLLKLAEESPIFEIRNYDRDIRSYRKLVPALRDFPEAVIVTVDDDVAYDRDMLRDFLAIHKKYPDCVLAHRAKRIKPDQPYRNWKKLRWYHFLGEKIKRGYDIIQTGVGGVLYPPHALLPEMIDEELFTKLAPTTDDIWFWAAAVANGRMVMATPYGTHNKPKGLGKPKELSLKSVNFKSGNDRNDNAFKAILDKYPIISERLQH